MACDMNLLRSLQRLVGNFEIRREARVQRRWSDGRQDVIHCDLLIVFDDPRQSVTLQYREVLYEEVLDSRLRVRDLHVRWQFATDDFVELLEGDDFLRLFSFLVEVQP